MTAPARTRTELGAHKGAGHDFRTIVAKYPGKCKRCGGPIAVGDPIRWAPRKGSYHYKDYCGSDDAALERAEEVYGDTPAPSEVPGGDLDSPAAGMEYVVITEDTPAGLVRRTELRPTYRLEPGDDGGAF